jgi:hypothetical protein
MFNDTNGPIGLNGHNLLPLLIIEALPSKKTTVALRILGSTNFSSKSDEIKVEGQRFSLRHERSHP